MTGDTVGGSDGVDEEGTKEGASDGNAVGWSDGTIVGEDDEG